MTQYICICLYTSHAHPIMLSFLYTSRENRQSQMRLHTLQTTYAHEPIYPQYFTLQGWIYHIIYKHVTGCVDTDTNLGLFVKASTGILVKWFLYRLFFVRYEQQCVTIMHGAHAKLGYTNRLTMILAVINVTGGGEIYVYSASLVTMQNIPRLLTRWDGRGHFFQFCPRITSWKWKRGIMSTSHYMQQTASWHAAVTFTLQRTGVGMIEAHSHNAPSLQHVERVGRGHLLQCWQVHQGTHGNTRQMVVMHIISLWGFFLAHSHTIPVHRKVSLNLCTHLRYKGEVAEDTLCKWLDAFALKRHFGYISTCPRNTWQTV